MAKTTTTSTSSTRAPLLPLPRHTFRTLFGGGRPHAHHQRTDYATVAQAAFEESHVAASRTAAGAFMSRVVDPKPAFLTTGAPVLFKMPTTSAGVRQGRLDRMSAATPATCGVAMPVRARTRKRKMG